jgi:hypothetical protein
MVKTRIAGCLVVAPLLGACQLCTLSIEPAIEVEVRDRTTNQFLSVVPRGLVREGAYQDSLTANSITADAPPRVRSLTAAGERAGTYSVHLEADGYQPWDTARVRAGEGGCHVQTVRFTAALNPASPFSR